MAVYETASYTQLQHEHEHGPVDPGHGLTTHTKTASSRPRLSSSTHCGALSDPLVSPSAGVITAGVLVELASMRREHGGNARTRTHEYTSTNTELVPSLGGNARTRGENNGENNGENKGEQTTANDGVLLLPTHTNQSTNTNQQASCADGAEGSINLSNVSQHQQPHMSLYTTQGDSSSSTNHGAMRPGVDHHSAGGGGGGGGATTTTTTSCLPALVPPLNLQTLGNNNYHGGGCTNSSTTNSTNNNSTTVGNANGGLGLGFSVHGLLNVNNVGHNFSHGGGLPPPGLLRSFLVPEDDAYNNRSTSTPVSKGGGGAHLFYSTTTSSYSDDFHGSSSSVTSTTESLNSSRYDGSKKTMNQQASHEVKMSDWDVNFFRRSSLGDHGECASLEPNPSSRSSYAHTHTYEQHDGLPTQNGTDNDDDDDDDDIIEIWQHNLDYVFQQISEIADDYNYVAIDTEFPGIVLKHNDQTLQTQLSQSSVNYLDLRDNVNTLKIIQLGLTFSDKFGNRPKPVSTFQFNFKFDLSNEQHDPNSIQMLRDAGVNFDWHLQNGIDVRIFAEHMISSGLVYNDKIQWISFHGMYDFGYLIHVLSNEPLPDTPIRYFEHLKLYFPKLVDLKMLLRFNGGLNALAKKTRVKRIGPSHQGGSDARLTSGIFFKAFSLHEIDEPQSGDLFGLEIDEILQYDKESWEYYDQTKNDELNLNQYEPYSDALSDAQALTQQQLQQQQAALQEQQQGGVQQQCGLMQQHEQEQAVLTQQHQQQVFAAQQQQQQALQQQQLVQQQQQQAFAAQQQQQQQNALLQQQQQQQALVQEQQKQAFVAQQAQAQQKQSALAQQQVQIAAAQKRAQQAVVAKQQQHLDECQQLAQAAQQQFMMQQQQQQQQQQQPMMAQAAVMPLNSQQSVFDATNIAEYQQSIGLSAHQMLSNQTQNDPCLSVHSQQGQMSDVQSDQGSGITIQTNQNLNDMTNPMDEGTYNPMWPCQIDHNDQWGYVGNEVGSYGVNYPQIMY